MPIKETIKKPEVSFWIAIIIPILAFAVQWGVMNSRMDELCGKCAENSDRLDAYITENNSNSKEIDVKLTEIQVELAEIRKDIQYIRDK